MKPTRPGWHWFLPDERCPTPTGLLRIDKPVVLLVGPERFTRDGRSRLVVRFPNATLYVDDMSGDWERIDEPPLMKRKAMERWARKKEPTDDHES